MTFVPLVSLVRTGLLRIAGALTVAAVALGPAAVRAQAADCGPIANAYGPFDYRTAKDRLPMVEPYHFSPEVEALIRGKSGYLGGDIDYTLRAFPNHHRALLSTMRYGERTKTEKPPDMQYTVECYFDRALRFKPDDTVARMLYVTYLNKHKRSAEAQQQMADVVRRAGDDGFTHYNAGLVYFEMKDYPLARQQAWRAEALGFTRTELRDQLKTVSQWSEAPAAPASAASASVATTATAQGAAGAASSASAADATTPKATAGASAP